MEAPLPGNEWARIEALRRYAILDTIPEQSFDDLTLLAAQICEAPVALVSFVDTDRVWFKSRVGFDTTETSREGSFCSWAISEPDLFIVPDALHDERFATNHLVTAEPPIRFYAGVSLVTSKGHALGTICVIDHVARDLNARQRDALRALGRQTMTQLELRRQLVRPAEERLRETESKYKLLVEQASDGIHTYDFDGNFIDANPKLCEMLGYTREELLRLNVTDLMPAGDLAANPVRFDELRAGNTLLKERRLRRKDGTLLPVEISGRMLTDGVLQGIIRDITVRKRAEEAIRFQSHLLDTVEQAVIATDLTGKIIYWNRFAERLYGWPAAEIFGRNIIEVTPSQESQEGASEIMAQLSAGHSWSGEFTVQRRDGTSFSAFVTNTPIYGDEGMLIGIVGVSRDITERKRSEAALRRSEERYRTLFQTIDDGFCVLEMLFDEAGQPFDYRFLEVNPAFERQTGLEQAVGKTARELVPQLDGKWFEIYGKVALTGEAVRIENHAPAMNRWFDVRASRVGGDESRKVALLFTNITERKQVEEERSRLLRSLEEERSRLADLFTQAPAFVAVLRGPDHIFEVANPPYMQLIGNRDVLGKGVREALPEIEGQGYFELLDEVYRTGEPHVGKEMSVMVRREPEREPEERFLDFVYQPMFDADGSVSDIFLHGVDITERKRAEEALRESEEWLRAIFEASRDGILVEDDERIVYVNKSYTDMFGYDAPEELIGKHVSTVISKEDAERMLEFGRRRAQGEPVASIYEFKGKRKDGSLIDIEASVSAPTIAGQTYITTIVRDIAERKRAEEALRRAKDELEERVEERTAELSLTNVMLVEQIKERERIEAALSESEARFRGVFENTTVGLYRTTPDGRILLANPAVLRMLGYSSFDQVAAFDLEQGANALSYTRREFRERLEREGEIRDLEATWKRADGSLAFVRENAKVVRGNDNAVLYYEGTIEDITERKHAEDALAHVRNRLMTAQEDERRHLSRELHDEAGQSLMAIAMRLQRLENQLRARQFDPSSAREEIAQLRSIVQATQRDLRRMAHALHPAALEYFGLAKALGGVINEVCADGRVKCSVDVPEDFPRFTPAVECTIYRIVQEAVTNAWKHADARAISLRAAVRDGVAAIALEDDGAGFDVSEAKARGGFGLIGMRERAEIIGAKLHISSTGEKGTMIKLQVPLEGIEVERFKPLHQASGSEGEQDENENYNRGRSRAGTPEHRLTTS